MPNDKQQPQDTKQPVGGPKGSAEEREPSKDTQTGRAGQDKPKSGNAADDGKSK